MVNRLFMLRQCFQRPLFPREWQGCCSFHSFTFELISGIFVVYRVTSPCFNLIIFFENIIEIINIDRISSLGISAELRYIQFTIFHLDAWPHIVFFLLFLFGNRNLHLGQKSAILLTFNIVLYLWIEVFKSDVINLNVHTFRFTSALKSTVICFFRLEIWLNLTQTIGEYLFIHPDQQFLVLQKHLK